MALFHREDLILVFPAVTQTFVKVLAAYRAQTKAAVLANGRHGQGKDDRLPDADACVQEKTIIVNTVYFTRHQFHFFGPGKRVAPLDIFKVQFSAELFAQPFQTSHAFHIRGEVYVKSGQDTQRTFGQFDFGADRVEISTIATFDPQLSRSDLLELQLQIIFDLGLWNMES
jgi:hypothetical protein